MDVQGLARRFQLEQAWEFEDYDDQALFKIICSKAAKMGFDLDIDSARAAVAVLSKERMKPNFGNAGAVSNLLANAMLRMESRLKSVLRFLQFGLHLSS